MFKILYSILVKKIIEYIGVFLFEVFLKFFKIQLIISKSYRRDVKRITFFLC